MSLDPKSSYYDAGGIQTLDILRAKLTKEQYLGYILGNILKYATRLNFKNQYERDVEKILVYAEELSNLVDEEPNERDNRSFAESPGSLNVLWSRCPSTPTATGPFEPSSRECSEF